MICFSVEFDHMLISVESKETINSVDNPYTDLQEYVRGYLLIDMFFLFRNWQRAYL